MKILFHGFITLKLAHTTVLLSAPEFQHILEKQEPWEHWGHASS